MKQEEDLVKELGDHAPPLRGRGRGRGGASRGAGSKKPIAVKRRSPFDKENEDDAEYTPRGAKSGRGRGRGRSATSSKGKKDVISGSEEE